jgi:hypothetical protein
MLREYNSSVNPLTALAIQAFNQQLYAISQQVKWSKPDII